MTDTPPNPHIEVRQISLTETFPLRLQVLRPGRPVETARFPGDDAEDTRHFGAFASSQLLGIASIFKVDMPGRSGQPAFQLRGMATAPQARGAGLGRALLAACIDYSRAKRAVLLWCNARTSAAGFYQKLGFAIAGDEFQIPDVGPHFRMFLTL